MVSLHSRNLLFPVPSNSVILKDKSRTYFLHEFIKKIETINHSMKKNEKKRTYCLIQLNENKNDSIEKNKKNLLPIQF